MKKVLGISGSPRRGGNTEILLDEALEGSRSRGAKIEKIVLNDLRFKPCQECGGCDKTGKCIIEDDLEMVYEKVEEADCLIIASPIFFGSLSAQLKMMIDRFQCTWVKKYILKKRWGISGKAKRRGVFLCVSAAKKNEFFENADRIMKIFFRTLDIDYFGHIFYGGAEKKAAIQESEDVLKKAFELGAKLVSGH